MNINDEKLLTLRIAADLIKKILDMNLIYPQDQLRKSLEVIESEYNHRVKLEE